MSVGQGDVKYLDAGQSIEVRIKDLVGRMTLRDKLRQMGLFRSSELAKNGKFDAELAEGLFDGMGVGVIETRELNPVQSATFLNELQDFIKDRTRLGIPALPIAEALNGVCLPDATVFPQSIGLSSAWNADLMLKVATVIAKEARTMGIAQSLSPVLCLGREPRWGRVEESYGEDSYLSARLGVSYIKGLQGEGPVIDGEHVVATPKHYAAHGSPEGGLNLAPVHTGERELRELYLVPFKAAVVEAGALSIMPAYSEFDGIPCSSSKLLLRRILREEWGFQGYFFSDYGAVRMLMTMHHTAETPEQAGKQALEAGMDLEAPDMTCYGDGLVKLIEEGQVDEALVDEAVANILRVKFLAGLFENPYTQPERAAEVVNCDAHRALALEAAHESIVLLKNDRALLPLDPEIESVAVIGPNADAPLIGDYSYSTTLKENIVTPLQGIRSRVAAETRVVHAKGCGIYGSSKQGFDEAVEAARKSKAAIVIVGGSSVGIAGTGWGTDGLGEPTCGEGIDRSELQLSGVQQELVEAVVATGTPVIVVLAEGRPLCIPWIAEHVPAVLEAWYPGERGGDALADIIFGKVNPSGKLTVSFPKSEGHLPVYYDYKPSARGYYHNPGSPEKPGQDYVFADTEPLYEFGFGLSYTEFEYRDLAVSPAVIGPGGRVEVSVTVENVGKRSGKEAVQLYVNDVVSSVSTPVKMLRGFKKIEMKPHEAQEVTFVLAKPDLQLFDEHMEPVVEPGTFEVMIGNLTGRFEVR